MIETEVLVIGSGFGAAAPALRLAEAGLRVMMIEKGKKIVPEEDFRQTSDPKHLLEYMKTADGDNVSFTYAEALGGGSGFYEMVSLRAPLQAFDQLDDRGHRLWPLGINRALLDPYYNRAEKMLHVEQIHVADIPKSGVVFSHMMKNLGYTCDRARYAVKGCVGSGYCISGCVFGAKQSLHLNYLPQAVKVGLQILTDTEAESVRELQSDRDRTDRTNGTDGKREKMPYRYEVICRDRRNDERFVVRAKVLVLGGGTVGTAELLLRSRGNLPFLSEHVGKNIAFNGSVKVAGILPEGFIEGDMLSGRSHPGMISYHFLESEGITISCAKPLPLFLVHGSRLVLEGEQRQPDYWGAAHVELMKMYRKRMIILYALGFTQPRARLRESGTGVSPALSIDDGLSQYYHKTESLLHSILRKNGCRIIRATPVDHEGTPRGNEVRFESTHMVGSCRMADSKERGVVDVNGEVFGYPGMYVSDGACVPSSLAVNSSLTILANAERIAEGMVRRLS